MQNIKSKSSRNIPGVRHPYQTINFHSSFYRGRNINVFTREPYIQIFHRFQIYPPIFRE